MNITTQTQALMRICPPQHQSPQLVTQEAFVSVRPGVAAAAADVKRRDLPLDGVHGSAFALRGHNRCCQQEATNHLRA